MLDNFYRLWFLFCWEFLIYTEDSGIRALNRLMHTLYNSDVWLPRDVALECVRYGIHFREIYGFLAAKSYEKKEVKFCLAPKLHSFEEIIFRMKHQCQLSDWVYNPINESCSLDEDFIGHAAYITRHVSPRLMALRTFNRYLTQIILAWRLWKVNQCLYLFFRSCSIQR